MADSVDAVTVRGDLVDDGRRQKFFGAQPRTEKAYPNGFNVEMGLMELASADHRPYRILAVPVRPTAC